MNSPARLLVHGRRGLRAIEQPDDGGAIVYFGDFGETRRRPRSPLLDFDLVEEDKGRGGVRPFLVSLAAHIMLAIVACAGWRNAPALPEPALRSGISVTFVEEGGQPRSTQSQVQSEQRKDKGHNLIEQAKPVEKAPLPVEVVPAKVGVPVSSADASAGPAPAPKAETDAEQTPNKAAVPGGTPAAVNTPEEDKWESAILARLERKKRYPSEAMRAGKSDVVMLRVTIDRHGRLLLAELVKSLGIAALDKETLALAKRAEPYPEPPSSVTGDAIPLLVPIEFVMRQKR